MTKFADRTLARSQSVEDADTDQSSPGEESNEDDDREMSMNAFKAWLDKACIQPSTPRRPTLPNDYPAQESASLRTAAAPKPAAAPKRQPTQQPTAPQPSAPAFPASAGDKSVGGKEGQPGTIVERTALHKVDVSGNHSLVNGILFLGTCYLPWRLRCHERGLVDQAPRTHPASQVGPSAAYSATTGL